MAGESWASAPEHTATLGQPDLWLQYVFVGGGKTQECLEEANTEHGILGGRQGIWTQDLLAVRI